MPNSLDFLVRVYIFADWIRAFGGDAAAVKTGAADLVFFNKGNL